MKPSRWMLGAACSGTLLSLAGTAAALPCNDASITGTPVYVTGSSASKPLWRAVSNTLLSANPSVRLIYQSVGSCQGLDDVINQKLEKKTGTYWDPNATCMDKMNWSNCELSCDVPIQGVQPDVAISDVFPGSCSPSFTVPQGMTEFQGPIQIFGFVVPPLSQATSISMEAAYLVYGFGAASNPITPWTDPNFIFRRSNSSGTYTMTSKLTGLDITKFKGTYPMGNMAAGSSDILTAVANANAMMPDKAIGVLSADYFDANRTGASAVRVLAYQHKGAACGLFPDSSKDALDKANVRSGLYPFFGPLHFVTKTNMGTPAKAEVAAALKYITWAGLSAQDKQTMIDAEIKAYTVPQCAMNVKRTAEVAPTDAGLQVYTAAQRVTDGLEPCGCYYENKATGKMPAACTTCTDNSTCNGGKCRYGFCEAM